MPQPMPDDPEIVKFIRESEAFYPADAIAFTVAENRAWYDRYCEAFRAAPPPGVASADAAVVAELPQRLIPTRRYRRREDGSFPGTTLLYLHGGGFMLGGLDSHHDVCAEFCARTGLDVVSVDYRLAPEHTFPAALDDAQAAWRQLVDEGRRVVVAGDSGGGNLAVGVCLRARRQGLAMPAGQLLIYPGLGGDAGGGSYLEMAEAPMLTRADTCHYFRVYSGGRERGSMDDPEIAPLQARDFRGLPPAAIFAAHIDPVRDDAAEYARRLAEAGIAVRYRDEAELVHGYLRARHMSRRAAASFTAMCEAIVWLAHLPAVIPAKAHGR